MLRLPNTLRGQTISPAVLRAFSTTRLRPVSAPGPKDGPKGNATGLDTNTDGMKTGNKDYTNNKTPVDQQKPTPDVGGGDPDVHPAKQPEAQPEPTRSTGIKGKEEMG